MFKSQLEPPPESYESTAIFVENIFDTVKKAKAAKAAAAKTVEPSFDYSSFGNLSPVKKKKPRKNAKKNAKTKKPTTPKKKLTLRKAKTPSKDTPEKRKKASPAKSPRKYTKRAPKVPAAADIDDEEAAFILSSISQRSFDSFYSRLNSCETNKIHIPIDISTHSPTKTLSTRSDPIRNLAYYVMLDHNYWVGPDVPAAVEPVKEEPAVVAAPVTAEPEVQIHFKIQHSEPKLLINNELQQNATDNCETTTSAVQHVYDKVKEVNNNKFPMATDAAPLEQKSIKTESTAVKKRWLRQAATEMKSPPKKRKKENFMEVEEPTVNGDSSKHYKCEDIELPLPVNESQTKKLHDEIKIELKTATPVVDVPVKLKLKAPAATVSTAMPLESPVQNLIQNSVHSSIKASVQPFTNHSETLRIETPAKASTALLLVEASLQLLSGEAPEIDSIEEPLEEAAAVEPAAVENDEPLPVSARALSPVLASESPVQHVKSESSSSTEVIEKLETAEAANEAPEEQPKEIEVQPEISIEKVKEEPIIDIKAESVSEAEADKATEQSQPVCDEDESDEQDEKCWESVMDFHRLQLEQLQKKNKRFSLTHSETLTSFKAERTSPEQTITQLNYESKLNSNRLPRLHTRFSLFESSDYLDPRKALRTSLSLETTQQSNNVGPAPFQRSTSDISLNDVRRNRWSGTNAASAPLNSSSTLPFNSFYTESHQFNRDEPYSKTSYSTYRSTKNSWLSNQTPNSMDSSWESQKSNNSFGTTYSSLVKDAAVSSVFKSEDNLSLLQKISSTPTVLLAKTKTSSCDPRLNPTLVQEVRKEENSAPKKKLSLDQYRKRVSLTSTTTSPPAPEESLIHASPAFDPAIAAAALTG